MGVRRMGDIDLTLTGLEEETAEVLIAGVAVYQMEALKAGAIPKVVAAGETFTELADQEPDLLREVFLRNQDAFRVGRMPDEVLDQLDLEVRDGKLYERTDDGDFVEVELDE